MTTPTPTHTPPAPTVEQIAQHYKAALDSVALVTRLAARTDCTKEELASIVRNKEHLKLMVAKTYWTTEDMTPFNTAIAATVMTPVAPV